MSSASFDSSHSPTSSHTPLAERPLIVAAYRFGDPSHKRRVKVPPNTAWGDFLGLLYSRLNISPELEVEIFDEQSIEIVSVEDLVENDILVIKEKRKKQPPLPQQALKASGYMPSGYDPRVSKIRARPSSDRVPPFAHHPGSRAESRMASLAVGRTSRTHDLLEPSFSTVGVPQLSHFIQCNSFGYYFLAEVENMKILPNHGKIRRTHCIVKVPHLNKVSGSFQTFECEANLLRKISGHKCIISAPSIQVLNFSDQVLQRFLATVSPQKQLLLRNLVTSGGCTEAYVYPLYGVTMATKIKAGLTPDKALKYAFQLADIMNYLHQRGVIHQNLLPENIQVMSNDRAMLCNFETAIQADPSNCLLVVSRSVVPPSNKKGLAPEVISAFARVDMETIDFSTQYPWSFGVLSVLMATGRHPLQDYPSAFEVRGRREGREREARVKYRSASYQALPDSNQYPGAFCRLVRRSLSCDPTKRPTLVQILQVMKRDGKTVELLTGRRAGREGEVQQQSFEHNAFGARMESTERTREDGDPYSRAKHQALRPQPYSHTGLASSLPPSLPYGRAFSANFPTEPEAGHYRQSPSKRSKTDRHSPFEDRQPRDSLVRSHDPQTSTPVRPQYPYVRSHDPHVMLPHPFGSFNQPDDRLQADSRPRHQWFSFEDPTSSPVSAHYPSSARNVLREGPMRRYGSQGAFSDDFVSPNLSRGISDQNLRHSSDSLRMATQSKALCTTSESDLSQLQDFQYQRLVTTPDFSHGERPPSSRSDQDRLLQLSSPDLSLDTDNMQVFPRSVQEFTSGMRVLASTAQGHGVHRSTSSPQGYPLGAPGYPSGILDDAPSTSDETMDESNTTETDQTPELPRASNVARTQSYKVATNISAVDSSLSFSRPKSAPQQPVGLQDVGEGRPITEPLPLITPDIQTPQSSQELMDIESMTTGRSQSHDSHVTMSQDVVTMSQGDRSQGSTAEMDTATTSDRSQSTSGAGMARSMEPEVREDSQCVFHVGGPPGEEEEEQATDVAATSQSVGTTTADVSIDSASSQPLPYPFLVDGSFTGLSDPSATQESQESATAVVGSRSGVATEGGVAHSQPLGDDMDTPKVSRSDKVQFQVGLESGAGQDGGVALPEDDELTPRQSAMDDREEEGEGGRQQNSPAVSSEASPVALQSSATTSPQLAAQPSQSGQPTSLAANQSATLGGSSNQPVGPSSDGSQLVYGPGVVGVGLGYMSPIPEASQECSSQTQTQTTTERLVSSRSPSSEVEDIETALRNRSVSPFRHSALDDGTSTPRSQSAVSEHSSSAQASAVTALTALRIQVPLGRASRGESPQLEPPSSDTSHSVSTTNSSSQTSGETSTTHVLVSEVSTQAHVSGPQPHPLPPQPHPLLPPPPQLESQPLAAAVLRNHPRAQKRAWSEVRVQTNRSVTPARSNASAPPHVGAFGSLSPRSGSQHSGSGLSPSSGRTMPLQPPADISALGPDSRLTDYPRVQHRISQDLEMMNLAISGMDSQGSSGSDGSGRIPSVTLGVGPMQPHGWHPGMAGPPSRPASTTRSNLDNLRTFRPITPAIVDQRSFSAGPTVNIEPQTLPQRIPTRQVQGLLGVDRSSVPPPQVPIDSYDYLPPYSPPQADQSPPPNSTAAPTHQLYSPTVPDQHPTPTQRQAMHQQQTIRQQQTTTQQQQQQQQQQSSASLYPEPPPSYEDIFGPRQANGSKQKRSKQHGYLSSRQQRGGTQGHPELRRAVSGSQAAAGPAGHRVLSRQGSGQKKLVSLTNLFRRSRSRHSQDLTASGEPSVSDVPEGDHTANWVAAYSRTPRPQLPGEVGLPQFGSRAGAGGRDARSVISTGSVAPYSHAPSMISHAISDTTSSRPLPSRNPPIPYRNPPPFLTPDHLPQSTPTISSLAGQSRAARGGGGNSATSIPSGAHSTPPMSRLPVRQNRSPVIRRNWSRDRQTRPRPYSEIMASEDVEIFQPSAGLDEQGRRRVGGAAGSAGSLSSSCFDITAQPTIGQTHRQATTAQTARSQPPSAQPSAAPPLVSLQDQPLFSNANGNNTNTSQTVSPCASPTQHTPGASQSNSSTAESAVSSRSGARTRRAMQAASQYSSSDDDTPNQQPRRVRKRRGHDGARRGGQSQSPEAIQDAPRTEGPAERSHDLVVVSHDHATSSHDHPIAVQGDQSLVQTQTSVSADVDDTGSHDQPVEPHDQPSESHDHQLDSPDSRTAPVVQSNGIAGGQGDVTMEMQPLGVDGEHSSTIERSGVSGGGDDLSTPGSSERGNSGTATELLSGRSRSCGHRCAAGEQELCCLCAKEQHGTQGIAHLLQNCQICDIRSTTDSGEPRPLVGRVSGCLCLGNKRNSSCPLHSNQTPVPTGQTAHLALLAENGSGKRTGKQHCSVM